MSSDKLPQAIDLSHHLSDLSRSRGTSPLKGLHRFYGQPGLISLAGGLPHPAYFPFSSISADALVYDSFPSVPPGPSSFSWLWGLFSRSTNKEKTTPLSIPKYPLKPDDVSLSTALQYGMATGLPQLQKITKQFTAKVYQPAYENFATLVHTGNTDGLSKTFMTLCNPGEGILACEWTYPTAMAAMLPHGIKPVAVSMDGQGMRSDDLRIVLSEWNEGVRGMPRPHVMYTVPVGQNPTGSTMGSVRKKEIYDICVLYDVIIVEDDPYFFLQQGPYVPKAERKDQVKSSHTDEAYFISHLVPSYLKFDFQGRVVRLDTFSKTIAPGCRLGWFTCNSVFAERLERQAETSTQAPCGFGQSLVASVLLKWGYEGYVRWLKALGLQYKQRRDFFVDCMAEEFQLQLASENEGIWGGCNIYLASRRPRNSMTGFFSDKFTPKERTMFSFVPPTSGMFVWIKVHLENYPSFTSQEQKTLERKLWVALAEAGVLVCPGWMFSVDPVTEDTPGQGHFRISFSHAEFEDMKKAVNIFGSVLRDFFKDM